MKVTIEIEVPDDFEPYTIGCADYCPFGYVDWEDCECTCSYSEHNCPLLKAMSN